ncbi:MAG: ABC transporter substrate-binding protein, partial [Burkholderiales bacterium]
MKALLRSALICAAALVAVAAGPAHAAKDVVFAVASNFTTTDPYDANDTLSQAMAKSFYQGLFGFEKDMKVIPVLAESYDVSKDGLVYTIKLKQGIKFHDGTDFKADAVKANFDRVTNPDNKLKRYSLYSNIARTEVVDDYTARVTLKTPFSAFINQLAHPSGVMISPVALQKYGKDIAFNPVGTGPFKFVQWRENEMIELQRNPDYFEKGLPYLDKITIQLIKEPTSAVAALISGQIDALDACPFQFMSQLRANKNLQVYGEVEGNYAFL